MLSPFNNWTALLAKLFFSREGRRGRRPSNRRAPHRFYVQQLETRRALTTTVTVTALVDTVDGDTSSIAALETNRGMDGEISLREAVRAANNDLGTDTTITFSSSLPTLPNGTRTITLLVSNGPLVINRPGGAPLNLTIDGTGLSPSVMIQGEDPTPNSHNDGDGVQLFQFADPSGGSTPPNVTIAGLTLTGADPAPGGANTRGGAIYSQGLLTLRNMVISNNGAGFGGGVYVAPFGSGPVLDIESSQINNISAYIDGGAVYLDLSSSQNSQDTVSISNSTWSNNVAGSGAFGRGGAIFINTSGYDASLRHSVTITATHFNTNSADRGGAISDESHSRVDLSILQGSTITGNTARTDSGGALYANTRYSSQFLVQDSTVSGNSTLSSFAGSGGGIAARTYQSSSLNIERSVISGNVASSGDGGGVFAVANFETVHPFPTPRAITITQSLISGNTATDRGGGLYLKNFDGTEALVQDSRVTGNSSGTSGTHRNGGGIYAYVFDGSVGMQIPKFTITRSTVDNNHTDQNGGGIFVCAKVNGYFVATNSTFSANTSNGSGGGIFIAHFLHFGETVDAYLRNLTVTQNVCPDGGGVGILDTDGMRVRIANSLISKNFNPSTNANNLVGRLDIANTQYNLVGSGSTILDLNGNPALLDSTNVNNLNLVLNDDPHLSGLANHGGAALPGDAMATPPIPPGPAPTHVLLGGSLAIDRGSNALASDPLPPNDAFTTDQRGPGFLRSVDLPGGGSGAFSVDIGAVEVNVPKVVGVTISTTGTSSTSAPYDVPVGSGEQIRTVPVGQANQILIHFSEDVTIAPGYLTPMSSQGHTYTIATTGGFGYSTTNQTATWTYASAFLPDQIAIDLTADKIVNNVHIPGVTGLAGSLDGEWTNPTSLSQLSSSVWPSGNGVAGGDFVFYVTILPGDNSRDNIVQVQDLITVKNYFGLSPATWIQGDTDGHAGVDIQDLLDVKNYFGTNFTQWPHAGGGMMTMSHSSGGQDWARIEKIRAILDNAFGGLTTTSVVDASWLSAKLDEVIAAIGNV
jgi:hypothetical protein